MRRTTSEPPSSTAPRVSGDTGTVSRIASLLRLAAELPGPFSLKDMAAASGLPVPTTYRLLDLLVKEGLLAHDGARRGYRIGTELYRIGSLVRARAPTSDLIVPILSKAVTEVGETCHFAQYLPVQLAVMFDSRVEAAHQLDFRWEFHKPLSLVWGASGRTILAYLPEEKVTQALAAEDKLATTSPPPSRRDLDKALQDIRRLGYGFTRGQRVPGAVSILAPVFDEQNRIFGALGFTLPEQRFTDDRLNDLVRVAKKSANELSAALGADPRNC